MKKLNEIDSKKLDKMIGRESGYKNMKPKKVRKAGRMSTRSERAACPNPKNEAVGKITEKYWCPKAKAYYRTDADHLKFHEYDDKEIGRCEGKEEGIKQERKKLRQEFYEERKHHRELHEKWVKRGIETELTQSKTREALLTAGSNLRSKKMFQRYEGLYRMGVETGFECGFHKGKREAIEEIIDLIWSDDWLVTHSDTKKILINDCRVALEAGLKKRMEL